MLLTWFKEYIIKKANEYIEKSGEEIDSHASELWEIVRLHKTYSSALRASDNVTEQKYKDDENVMNLIKFMRGEECGIRRHIRTRINELEISMKKELEWLTVRRVELHNDIRSYPTIEVMMMKM